MAGHSKWKNIKHKKAATDAIKMKKFTKLSKEITIAAKMGSDISSNPTLRMLIEKANMINMPKENYLRAIKKALGSNKIIYESTFYQGYGPANIAFLIEVLSDNKNKAAANVRYAFSHNGGMIAEPGSVDWLFLKCGLLEGKTIYYKEEEFLEELLDFKLYDFSYENGYFFIAVHILDLQKCKDKLQKIKCEIYEDHIGYHPQEKIILTKEESDKLELFIDSLEEIEDVQNIYFNA